MFHELPVYSLRSLQHFSHLVCTMLRFFEMSHYLSHQINLCSSLQKMASACTCTFIFVRAKIYPLAITCEYDMAFFRRPVCNNVQPVHRYARKTLSCPVQCEEETVQPGYQPGCIPCKLHNIYYFVLLNPCRRSSVLNP